MTVHQDEVAIRGHGPRPAICDHECTRVQLGSNLWCRRCGALHIDGQWETPTLLSAAIRDRDTMHTTLTIVQTRCTELVEENRTLKARLTRYDE